MAAPPPHPSGEPPGSGQPPRAEDLPPAPGSEFGQLTVLVVDDVFNLRATIKNMIRALGFAECLEAKDGLAAQELLSTRLVDLVLCDWNMPGMDGLSLLRWLRGHPELKTLPFIMVTGEASQAAVAEAAETEVDAYLAKPFTSRDLLSRIREVLDRQAEATGLEEHLERGRAFVVTGQLDKALREFRAALGLNPNSPRTHLALGQLYQERGNDQQARKHYQQAVAISPNFLKGHEALANLLRALGDREGYLRHLRQAVRISPRNLERRFELGRAELHRGDGASAREVFKDILKEASSQYSELAMQVGEALLQMGAFPEAEEAFGKALVNDPVNLHVFNQLGIAFRRQGKYREAVANYLRALKAAPSDENLHYNLARAYFEMKNFPAATATLQRALRLNPDFAEARELLDLVERQATLPA